MQFAQHVLIPTDFSEAAEIGIEKGAALARQSGARVTLVHVFDPAPLAPIATRNVTGSAHLKLERDLESTIHAELERIRDEKLGGILDVKTALVLGSNAAEGIMSYARKEDADLIVMSTHGRTGLGHLLIGSVAEKVVRHAHCPVLVVPWHRTAAAAAE